MIERRVIRLNPAGGNASLALVAAGLVAVASVAVAAGAGSSPAPSLQLVETFPIETLLDHPELPDAHDVWPAMIGAAERSLDFAEFYASSAPGSRLESVIAAIEAAAARGVRVRFLAEEKFYRTYPETLDRLAARPNIEVRRYDVGSRMGGVLHAKYFVVDDREAFLGSQNFDWRSLTHIQELGVRVSEPAIVSAVSDVFALDWALAGGADLAAARAESAGRPSRVSPLGEPPSGVSPGAATVVTPAGGDSVRISMVASPRDWLPDGVPWDLPRIVALIDGARASVRVQLLTYRTTDRDGTYFDALEIALRRAAARGVRVQLLAADWSKRSGTIEGLQSLQALPEVEVKLTTIPQWSGGFIPFARVSHAKYLVIDGHACWIGTSNWEKSYFHDSRNLGLIVEGGPVPPALDRYFVTGWESPYAVAVDPCARYEPPRIGE